MAPEATVATVLHEDLIVLLAHTPLRELHGRRILVTGGTGFFGQWLVTAIALLNGAGANIELVLTSRDPQRALADCRDLLRQPWLQLTRCDLRHDSLPEGPFDAILHGAADTSKQAAGDPLALYTAIVDGARKALQLASRLSCTNVLLVSSGAVYGAQAAEVPFLDETASCSSDPRDLDNAYTEGKRAMETLAACFAAAGGPNAVIARCFAFTGAGLPLDGHFAIGNFIRDALADRPIRIAGNGRPVRSYLYAADLAIWLLVLLARGRPGGVYNVGSDRAVSVLELAERVRDVLNPNLPVTVENREQGAARLRYVPSIEAARRDLGLDVWTSLERAISRTATPLPPRHRGIDIGRSQLLD